MKQGLSVEEVDNLITAQAKLKRDYLIPTSEMQMVDVNHISVPKQNKIYSLQELAHAQLATRLDIPKAYYDKHREKNPDLIEATVNYREKIKDSLLEQ